MVLASGEKTANQANNTGLQSSIVYWNPKDEDTHNMDGTIYVHKGDDENSGTEASKPVLSFEKVLELVKDEGTVYIMQTSEISGQVSLDGEDKNIKIKRWPGTAQAQAFVGQMFNIMGNSALTLKNIKLDDDGSNEKRAIQLVDDSSVLNISTGVEIDGYIYYERTGGLIRVEEEPPSQAYALSFNDNIDFDGQKVVEGMDFEIASYIEEYFSLHVLNVPSDANYIWLLVPTAERQIEAERRDLYPGVYLNGTEEGNDENDGLSPERPVKTFERAKEVAKESEREKIYITGRVTINKDTSWSLPEEEYPNTKIYRYEKYKGILILLGDEANLKLKSIAIDGNSENGVEADFDAIRVKSNAILTMGEDSILQNLQLGGNNNGAGVVVEEDGIFNMESNSRITNSRAGLHTYGNGGGVFNYGLMTMKDQSQIDNCYAYDSGSAITNYGDGTLSLEGNASLNSNIGSGSSAINNNGVMYLKDHASISDNPRMTGILNENGTLNIEGGEIKNNGRYGIQIGRYSGSNATINMTGGVIKGNKTAGIFIRSGKANLEKGLIEDNGGEDKKGIILNEGSSNNWTNLNLDAGMDVKDTIILNHVTYPITLTDKEGLLSNGKGKNFSLYTFEGATINKRGYYSGSIIVKPDKDTVDDAAPYADLFTVQTKYRTAGYGENIMITSNVYIDGVDGDDNNSGLNPENAVKTWDKAVEVLEENKGQDSFGNIIYVVNKVTVSEKDSMWSAKNTSFQDEGIIYERFQHYLGTLLEVEADGELQLEGIAIRGMNETANRLTQTITAGDSTVLIKGQLSLNEDSRIEDIISNKIGASVYVEATGSFTMSKNSYIYNSTTNNYYGGSIYGEENSKIIMKDSAYIEKTRVTSRTGAKGGAIYSNGEVSLEGETYIKAGEADDGGHIAIGQSGQLTLGTEDGQSNVKLYEGKVGGGLFGGAISIYGKGHMYKGTEIYDNTVLSGRNGIYVGKQGEFTMEGGEVYNNLAGGLYSASGGGAYIDDGGTFNLKGGSIYNNQVNIRGGGVYVKENGIFNMYGGEIKNNSVKNSNNAPGYNGGGIYLEGEMNFSGGTIEENYTDEDGGGIYITKTGKLLMGESTSIATIRNNHANRGDGGGIYNRGQVELNSGLIEGNKAGLGNGIYLAKDNTTKLGGKLSMTHEGSQDEIQHIYLSDEDNTLTLTNQVDDGIIYTLDTPNTFLGVIVVQPDGTNFLDARTEEEHFVPSERVKDDWGYQIGPDGIANLIIADDNSVFINGQDGDDNNDGSTPKLAVKTWERVIEILDNGKDGASIYIVDTVDVSQPKNGDGWSLEGYASNTVKRYAGFTDDAMILVPAGKDFSLKDIIIDGGYADSISTESATGSIDVKGQLELNENAIIQNGAIVDQIRKAAVTIYEGGQLTMNKDSSIRQNVKKTRQSIQSHGAGAYIYQGGKMTMGAGSSLEENKILNELRGNASYGGGIFNQGELNIKGGKVAKNSADSGIPYGGGIYIGSTGKASISEGEISENYLAYSSRSNHLVGGGGICVASGGQLNMTGGTIKNNDIRASEITTLNGSIDHIAGAGLYNNGSTNISGGSIENNGFKDKGIKALFIYGNNIYLGSGDFTLGGETLIAGGYNANGYGWWNRGGGIFWNSGDFLMTGGSITENTAGLGGGIAFIGSGKGSINITGGSISKNEATGSGGGIYNSARNAEFTIGNKGSEASVEDVIISENINSGLYSERGEISIYRATIKGNTTDSISLGGGISLNGGEVILTGTLIEENLNSSYSGGAINTSDYAHSRVIMNEGTLITKNTSNSGGNIVIGTRSRMDINGGTISENYLKSQGSTTGIYNKGTLNMNGGTISENTSPLGVRAGAIYNDKGTVNMSGGLIENSRAGGGTIREAAGAIYNTGSNGKLNISGGIIKNNFSTVVGTNAVRSAGAIYNTSKSELEITGGKIEGNVAEAKITDRASNYDYPAIAAGGIYIGNESTANIKNLELLSNMAEANAEDTSRNARTAAVGGIYLGGQADIGTSQIKNNKGQATAGPNAEERIFRDEDGNNIVLVTKEDIANGVGAIHLGRVSKLHLRSGLIEGNKEQKVDIYDDNYLKNGIFVGGEDSLYLYGKDVDVSDNIYLSKVGRVVTLTRTIDSNNRFNIAVSPDFVAGDTIIKPDGAQVHKAGIYYINFANSNQRYAVVDGDEQTDIILAKIIFLASYGDDKNDGSTPDLAVATFKRAFELMEHPKHDKIYISGTVYIGDAGIEKDNQGRTLTYGDKIQAWALPENASLTRYNGFPILGRDDYEPFLGDMVSVSDGAELNLGHGDSSIGTGDFNDIIITGNSMPDTEGSIIRVEEGGKLNTNEGTTLINNTTSANGGAIANYGTSHIKGGEFTGNNTSGKGVFVYQHGKLKLQGSPETNGNIGDVYLASNPEDKGYYIDIVDDFTPNKGMTDKLRVTLPLSDSYIYRKIAVYDKKLDIPNGVEKQKFDLPQDVLAIYDFHNSFKNPRILELYRDMSLSVTKELRGDEADVNKEFEFIVNLIDNQSTGEEIVYLPIGKFPYEVKDGNGNNVRTGEIELGQDGLDKHLGKFYLKGGQTIKISGIPTETKYHVEEKDYMNYITLYDDQQSGIIVADNLKEDGQIDKETGNESPSTVITNQHSNAVDLLLQKFVDGNIGDKTKDFTFELVMGEGNFDYIKNEGKDNEEEGSLSFEPSSTIQEVSLKHGETIRVKDIPVGTEFTIEETNGAKYTKYIAVNKQVLEEEIVDGVELINIDTGKIQGKADADLDIIYTNNLDYIPTGLFINKKPYIIILLIALAGFSTWFISYKRKKRHIPKHLKRK